MIQGGKATPAPPIGPALAPLKVNVGLIVSQINEKTKAFAGIDVPVKVIVDVETKEFEIIVGTPPVSALFKKELKVEKLATVNEDKSRKLAGSIPFTKILEIADSKHIPGTRKGKVKQILGTCVSCGVLIDGKNAKDVTKEVEEGKLQV